MAQIKSPVLDKLIAVPKVIVALLLLAVLAALLVTMRPDPATNELTAYFPRTVALYPGSEVRILGVRVGEVESVEPQAGRVKVTMNYERRYDVPADAKAVIISPAIVGDRFVQLTPAYTGGPKLENDAVLDVSRTATPVELDEIYQSLDDLSVALGPNKANKNGALDHLLGVSADNLRGHGAQLHQTIKDLGKFTGTLSNNKDELFDTVTQLNRFVGMLAKNDDSIRQFNQRLAKVAGMLADERQDLALALDNLGTALTAVSQFVEENKKALKENIEGLAKVTRILVNQRDALKETLDVAPLALNNLFLAYNPRSGTLDQRMNVSENVNQLTNDPALVLCAILEQGGNPGDACGAIKHLLDTLPKPGLNRSAPFASQQIGPVEVEHVDTSLAGLVEVGR
jgi:phospholipid/cholesterol/gamma-HCH transport system substrate-binding protein